MTKPSCLIFVDNAIHRIYKTLEFLRLTYGDLHVFNEEKTLIEYLELNEPDVILLNLDLQPNDGVTLLKEIRNRNFKNPPFVVIYSDKQDDFVLELALNSGADAFINFHQKPSVMKLFLRNLLKRKKQPETRTQKNVEIDSESYLVYRNGEAIQLPRKEFRLFELLFRSDEKFMSKTEIAEKLWNDATVATKRTIDVHIYNIRQFLGKRIIQSQKGRGYRINRRLTG